MLFSWFGFFGIFHTKVMLKAHDIHNTLLMHICSNKLAHSHFMTFKMCAQRNKKQKNRITYELYAKAHCCHFTFHNFFFYLAIGIQIMIPREKQLHTQNHMGKLLIVKLKEKKNEHWWPAQFFHCLNAIVKRVEQNTHIICVFLFLYLVLLKMTNIVIELNVCVKMSIHHTQVSIKFYFYAIHLVNSAKMVIPI